MNNKETREKERLQIIKEELYKILTLIKEYEKEQMDKEVYALIPKEWHPEIKMFTVMFEAFPYEENEFFSLISIDGNLKRVSSQDINETYNNDEYNPRDGELVRAADLLAAFIEAYVAIQNGCSSRDLKEAMTTLKNNYGRENIGGINLGELYADFD